MRKYALINNSVVTSIVDIEDVEYSQYISTNDMVIDIQDITPLPAIGWVMNGNKLEIPEGSSDREAFEEELNDRKCIFGTKLAKISVNKIGARNKILNKNGTQVITLLTQLLGVKSLMETGALGTARSSCIQLKAVYTEYADIFQYVIDEINLFEQANGL